MTNKLFHSDLTGKILKCFFAVYNGLGFGFLEKVYENALKMELEMAGLEVKAQKPIHVMYKGGVVGEYFPDLLVENRVIVEIKSVSDLNDEHEAQLINYLAATKIEVGLLLNYGPKPQYMRKIHTNISNTYGS
jgi:GxxExxY protein